MTLQKSVKKMLSEVIKVCPLLTISVVSFADFIDNHLPHRLPHDDTQIIFCAPNSDQSVLSLEILYDTIDQATRIKYSSSAIKSLRIVLDVDDDYGFLDFDLDPSQFTTNGSKSFRESIDHSLDCFAKNLYLLHCINKLNRFLPSHESWGSAPIQTEIRVASRNLYSMILSVLNFNVDEGIHTDGEVDFNSDKAVVPNINVVFKNNEPCWGDIINHFFSRPISDEVLTEWELYFQYMEDRSQNKVASSYKKLIGKKDENKKEVELLKIDDGFIVKPRILISGLAHHKDWELLPGILSYLHTHILPYGKDIQFTLFGDIPESIANDLSPFISSGHLIHIPPVPFSQYIETIFNSNTNIALILIDPTHPFNWSKSDLKYREYVACGLPTICPLISFPNHEVKVSGHDISVKTMGPEMLIHIPFSERTKKIMSSYELPPNTSKEIEGYDVYTKDILYNEVLQISKGSGYPGNMIGFIPFEVCPLSVTSEKEDIIKSYVQAIGRACFKRKFSSIMRYLPPILFEE
ncbi:MAG: hypothetical protein QW478_03325 [Candidatus Micrarchaeaceae archaeon]